VVPGGLLGHLLLDQPLDLGLQVRRVLADHDVEQAEALAADGDDPEAAVRLRSDRLDARRATDVVQSFGRGDLLDLPASGSASRSCISRR
jgi:hypothetical protein